MTATATSRSVNSGRPWVVLGVGGSKRSRGLQAARAALGLAPARLVEWRDWMDRPGGLDALLAAPCHLKIEPPGDDPQVHLRLLHDGCEVLGRPRCAAPEHGELLATDAWYAGFARAMRRLAAQVAGTPAQLVNAPADILAMTDKLDCQQRLQAHGVPTARLLGPVGGYDALRALLEAQGLDRVFIKARYGSSAAGVLAYRRNRRGDEQATTSAALVPSGRGPRLFNVKRLRSYHRAAEVRAVVDGIAAQQAYAEAWLPKPRCGAGHFDVRVLALDGRAAHRVARIGERAMTNLHLDSRRGEVDALLLPEAQRRLVAAAEQAAGAFRASRLVGLDIVVHQGEARVLEANAFGDLLPGLLWQGRDTHAALQAASP